MPVGRSFVQQVAGDGLVVGSFVQSLLPTEGVSGLEAADAAIIQSRMDALARGGSVSNGPSAGAANAFSSRLEEANYTLKAVATPPARMSIQSVDIPSEIVKAQFNPDQLRETIATHWNRFDIPGNSHQPLQYGYTGNDHIEFELLFDAGKAPQPIKPVVVTNLLAIRRQLKSWHYLKRGDSLQGIGDTQRLLFSWPNFGAMTCVLVSSAYTYEAFNSIGQMTAFRVQVQLEEISDLMVFAEDYSLADPFDQVIM
jgi:hypothetical protein